MRNLVALLTICFVAGCAGSPPKPPGFKGEYRPINKPGDTLSQPSLSALTRGIA